MFIRELNSCLIYSRLVLWRCLVFIDNFFLVLTFSVVNNKRASLRPPPPPSGGNLGDLGPSWSSNIDQTSPCGGLRGPSEGQILQWLPKPQNPTEPAIWLYPNRLHSGLRCSGRYFSSWADDQPLEQVNQNGYSGDSRYDQRGHK